MLANYLLCTDNTRYLSTGFVDSNDGQEMTPGDWGEIVENYSNLPLAQPSRIANRNYRFETKQIIDSFCEYVVSAEGAVEWQLQHVNSVCPTTTRAPNRT